MRKSEVRSRRSEIGGIVLFLIAALCPLTSLFAQATYVPRAIKELEDTRGVSLSLKFTPIWDGTKFTPRFILQSDVTDLVSDLSGKVPTSRTVNGHVLSSDVTIAYGDLDGPFPTLPASMGAVTSNFFTSYNSASGLFTKAQPVFSDLSGTPTTLAGYGITDGVANSRTVNGHPLSANVTVAYSELGGPFPTLPANTGATANQFFTAYADTTGLFTKAQPSIANLSDAGTLATWAGITPGTGVGTFLATPSSANLLAALTNETGTGAAVFGTSPTISTKLTLTGTTETTSNPVLDASQTWNSSGVTFTGLKLDVTNTASAAASLLMDLQVGGVSKAKFDKAGSLNIAGGITQLQTTGSNVFQQELIGPSTEFRLDATGLGMRSSGVVKWTAGATANSPDTSLSRNAPGILQFGTTSANALGSWLATNGTLSGTLAVTGASTLSGGLISGQQALSGAGAVNLTALTTRLTTTGIAQALTLADGVTGQIKIIVYTAEGAGTDTAVLIPTTATGFTSITFTAVGNAVTLQYFSSTGWMIISNYGTTVV